MDSVRSRCVSGSRGNDDELERLVLSLRDGARRTMRLQDRVSNVVHGLCQRGHDRKLHPRRLVSSRRIRRRNLSICAVQPQVHSVHSATGAVHGYECNSWTARRRNVNVLDNRELLWLSASRRAGSAASQPPSRARGSSCQLRVLAQRHDKLRMLLGVQSKRRRPRSSQGEEDQLVYASGAWTATVDDHSVRLQFRLLLSDRLYGAPRASYMGCLVVWERRDDAPCHGAVCQAEVLILDCCTPIRVPRLARRLSTLLNRRR